MHIGFIMDGNRRWAKSIGMPKFYGHKKGVENLESLLDFLPKYGVKFATVYALSTENMQREESELKDLFKLIETFAKKQKLFEKNQVKFEFIGKLDQFPESTKKALLDLREFTKDFERLNFQVAINYGGKDELVRCFKKLKENGEEISEENIGKYLDNPRYPDPEMIIRTGGKKRMSNFLVWQGAYAEHYYIDKMWPEFKEENFIDALEFLKGAGKNFGK
ncbi:di-trans,poly-cis-decaprenylcistransferase [Candidatus Gracilibacteria bacterium]|nr:di-trans,poly-cis-decaprenylcistransferase [Candidatus Gracilibacteria bacterium]